MQFSLDQFCSTVTALEKCYLTAKSSFLSSWRLWRRKTGCSAVLHFSGCISIFYFPVSALNTTYLLIFPTCLGQFVMPFKLRAWSCLRTPWWTFGLAPKNALKVNSGIETKLSNSQRLPKSQLASIKQQFGILTSPYHLSPTDHQFKHFSFMSSLTMQLKRKIGGKVVVFGSFLFYSIPTPWRDLKNHFQQAIPAPRVTMETLHLKIDLEEWKLRIEYASLMWFREIYGAGCT